MRVRKQLIARLRKAKLAKDENDRQLKDRAIIEAEDEKAIAASLSIGTIGQEVSDASESCGEEDSGELDWKSSRTLLVERRSKKGGKGKKRD